MCEQVAVLGDHHCVVVAVRDQRRLGDRLEASEFRRVGDPPACDCIQLSITGCEVGGLLAIGPAAGYALEVLHALRTASCDPEKNSRMKRSGLGTSWVASA